MRRGPRKNGTGFQKPNPKVRGDALLPFRLRWHKRTGVSRYSADTARKRKSDQRCGTSETNGHVTTKSSICKWGILYKSGVYALHIPNKIEYENMMMFLITL
jgi:hypothetical protein